jgi:hypothetical protein
MRPSSSRAAWGMEEELNVLLPSRGCWRRGGGAGRPLLPLEAMTSVWLFEPPGCMFSGQVRISVPPSSCGDCLSRSICCCFGIDLLSSCDFMVRLF